MKAAQTLRILIVEDSQGEALLIKEALAQALPAMHLTKHVTKLTEALALLENEHYDVALLDRSLPDADGFDGMHAIQNIAPKIPIVLLTGMSDESVALESISQGAQDYLYKDTMDGAVIKRAIQYAILRKQYENTLIIQANFDMLTGLTNRASFENRLDLVLAKMHRLDAEISLLFLDLDKFKQVNDTHGHLCGDILLKEAANRIKEVLRPYDAAARFGGDEFAVLLEDLTTKKDAVNIAKKLLHLFDEPFTIDGTTCRIGVSIGIASASGANKGLTRDQLMERADYAMYQAKKNTECRYTVFAEDGHQQKAIA